MPPTPRRVMKLPLTAARRVRMPKRPTRSRGRAVVVACRPWERMKDFPQVVESSPELRARTLAKWGHLLSSGS